MFHSRDNYKEKRKLYLEAKEKGLFWSYDKKLEYSRELDLLLIETILKYGDFVDLKKIFLIYNNNMIRRVWEEKLIKDTHFRKVNYFLARIFFTMNVEADYFKGGISDRGKKIRMLAS